MMIIGTIIGEIRIAMIRRRYGISGRDKPKAAKVPRLVARIVAQNPIFSEFEAALIQVELFQASDHQDASRGSSEFCIPKVSNRSYHRIE